MSTYSSSNRSAPLLVTLPPPLNGVIVRFQYNFNTTYPRAVALFQALATAQVNVVSLVKNCDAYTIVVGPGSNDLPSANLVLETLLSGNRIRFRKRLVVQVLQVPAVPGGLAALNTALLVARVTPIQIYFGETGVSSNVATVSIFFRVPDACVLRAQLALSQVGPVVTV